jgi:hypothetical protein
MKMPETAPVVNASAPSAAAPPDFPLDYKAAFLSYLIPGLGQVLQGRVSKGIVFFVGIYSLFFYGMAMGQMKNVWLPDASKLPSAAPFFNVQLGGVGKALYYRPQFLGQFWVGAVAWPATAHYLFGEPLPADGFADDRKGLPVIGKYMMTPTESELNTLQRDGNKRWDLGWVYTLIAGVLNLLVIYDAFAGPAMKEGFPDPNEPAAKDAPKEVPTP